MNNDEKKAVEKYIEQTAAQFCANDQLLQVALQNLIFSVKKAELEIEKIKTVVISSRHSINLSTLLAIGIYTEIISEDLRDIRQKYLG